MKRRGRGRLALAGALIGVALLGVRIVLLGDVAPDDEPTAVFVGRLIGAAAFGAVVLGLVGRRFRL